MKILKNPDIHHERNNFEISYLFCLISIFIFFSIEIVHGQSYNYKYWIQFNDKKHSSLSINRPQEFLSERSIQRRIDHNIFIDSSDIPVSSFYIDSLKSSGFNLLYSVKWFNGVVIGSEDTLQIPMIRKFEFVNDVKKIYTRYIQKSSVNEFKFSDEKEDTFNFNYGLSDPAISQVNGKKLHEMGYTGNSMIIALLDAGFYRVDILPAFKHLWQNNQIVAIHDFVNPNSDIFLENVHGMHVLSIIGGYYPGEQIGTAPGAYFALIRTEDVYSEFLVEEYNWAAGAEFADSVGADIISTSLGYSEFDDSTQNHLYSDLNGHKTLVSRAAEMAFKKGILVVASAGNEGDDPWKFILSPADGDNVIAVGAVDKNGKIAEFSSYGPRIDGAVKPNVVALGKNITIQRIDSSFYPPSSGTSYSAPVISGMAACLWQSFPEMENADIFKAIMQSASHYYKPDSLTGYGIPDFYKAYSLLTNFKENKNDDKMSVLVFPNPYVDEINIELINFLKLNSIDNNFLVYTDLYSLAGKKIYSIQYLVEENDFNFIRINDLDYLPTGIYILIVRTSETLNKFKIYKLR